MTAGPALFVVGTNPSQAVEILPHYTDSTLSDAPSSDSALARSLAVDLFARGGLVGSATLASGVPGSYSGSCTSWPTARVAIHTSARGRDDAAPPSPPAWVVAFAARRAISLPMDSVAMLAPADSARRAADVVRVASAMSDDTAAEFRGLPFAVHDAHRFALPDGTDGVVAELVRHLNEEANPREEHILLILERDSTPAIGGPPAYVPAYVERTSGREDDIESWEVLAGVLLGPRRTPAMIVSRDDGDGGSYTLLTRTGPGKWQVAWNSAYTGC